MEHGWDRLKLRPEFKELIDDKSVANFLWDKVINQFGFQWIYAYSDEKYPASIRFISILHTILEYVNNENTNVC
jgi:hypothetical protein